jgi:hypothetical protein
LGIILGCLVILLSGFSPVLLPVGIYWVSIVAAVPTTVLMFLRVVPPIEYCLGVMLGFILFISVSFSGWESLAPMIAIAQIIPFITTCIVVVVFSLIGSWWLKSHNKSNQSERF